MKTKTVVGRYCIICGKLMTLSKDDKRTVCKDCASCLKEIMDAYNNGELHGQNK